MPVFYDSDVLLDRLSRPGATRPHAFLFGSALTAPSQPDSPGVAGVSGMVELVRAYVQRSFPPARLKALDQELSKAANPYQTAFAFLDGLSSDEDINAIIRQGVLRAYQGPNPPPPSDAKACRKLERELDGWHLPEWVLALGALLANPTPNFAPTVFTTNFDPLIQIAIERAGGPTPRSSVLARDGLYGQSHGHGCHVIHLHGHWAASDTLHTSVQLKQARPLLEESLQATMGDHAIVVLGYGGWDDVFLSALSGAASKLLSKLEILWAFFEGDEAKITERNRTLLEKLGSSGGAAGGSRRVSFYKGVNLRELLPALRMRIAPAPPAEKSGRVPAPDAAAGRTVAPSLPSLDRLLVRIAPSVQEFDALCKKHFGEVSAKLKVELELIPDMSLTLRMYHLFTWIGTDPARRNRLAEVLRTEFAGRMSPELQASVLEYEEEPKR